MGAESYPHLDVKTLIGIRATHRQSLEVLATQASKFGVQVPVPIEHQIKDAIAEVNAINAELARRGIANDDPPPTSDLQTVIHHYHGTTFVGNRGVAIGGNADNAQISTGDGATLVRDSSRATDARGAQGYTEHADQVHQDFSRSEVSTSGGDYAGQDVAKTEGSSAAPATLRALIERTQAAASATQTEDEELADQLSSVAIQLREARRKLTQAQTSLRALGNRHPVVVQLAQGIGALIEESE